MTDLTVKSVILLPTTKKVDLIGVYNIVNDLNCDDWVEGDIIHCESFPTAENSDGFNLRIVKVDYRNREIILEITEDENYKNSGGSNYK